MMSCARAAESSSMLSVEGGGGEGERGGRGGEYAVVINMQWS